MPAGPSWNDDELSGLGFTTDAAAVGDGSLIAITKQIRLLLGPSGATATATLANVTSSASNTTLQASNTSRLGWACFNDSTSALYVKFGATASTSSFSVKLLPGGYYELPAPVYTGIIDGIWDSANGAARVTELT